MFIPGGTYKIQKTIQLKTGVILKGEKAYPYQTSELDPQPPQNDYVYQGTVLYATSGGSFLGGYMVLINVNPSGTVSADTSTWVLHHPEFHTGLSDLYFYNYNVINLKGVLAAGGFDIKYCR